MLVVAKGVMVRELLAAVAMATVQIPKAKVATAAKVGRALGKMGAGGEVRGKFQEPWKQPVPDSTPLG